MTALDAKPTARRRGLPTRVIASTLAHFSFNVPRMHPPPFVPPGFAIPLRLERPGFVLRR